MRQGEHLIFAKVIIIILLLCSNAYGALAKFPTQEQLDKQCIAVKLNIDNDIHYFAVRTIVKFDDTGFIVKFGKWGEGRNFIPKENILNWDEVVKSYEGKK